MAGPAQSARSRTRSNGGSLAAPVAVVGQATANRPNQRRAHPLAELGRKAAGARGLRRRTRVGRKLRASEFAGPGPLSSG